MAAATSETAGAHTGSDHTETFETIRYTADVVCIRGADVLVIERGWDPHKGMNALPGGHVDPGESSRAAAARELLEETGVQVDASDLMLVGVWDAPGRDPRGRYVTAVYVVTVPEGTAAHAGDDAAVVRWVPLDAPGAIAFDHGQIVATARRQHLACGRAIGTARRA
ncbi:NUDIX hydrolase [Streptomyces sp. NBC_01116]